MATSLLLVTAIMIGGQYYGVAQSATLPVRTDDCIGDQLTYMYVKPFQNNSKSYDKYVYLQIKK